MAKPKFPFYYKDVKTTMKKGKITVSFSLAWWGIMIMIAKFFLDNIIYKLRIR